MDSGRQSFVVKCCSMAFQRPCLDPHTGQRKDALGVARSTVWAFALGPGAGCGSGGAIVSSSNRPCSPCSENSSAESTSLASGSLPVSSSEYTAASPRDASSVAAEASFSPKEGGADTDIGDVVGSPTGSGVASVFVGTGGSGTSSPRSTSLPLAPKPLREEPNRCKVDPGSAFWATRCLIARQAGESHEKGEKRSV